MKNTAISIARATFVSLLVLACQPRTEIPAPHGAIPSEAQVEWQKLEYYMFIHFGPNTFTDVEWGDGKENPQVFNPTDLDCRQWAATARAAGMEGIIITAKHHDGFCLWPSAFSTHTVRESPWREGRGDLLRELSDACREYGLRFGVYLSPWDQNHPTYGTAEYNEVFARTLDEVLSGYGEVFEQWFDGANGDAHGTGKTPPYDWDMFHEVVYRNQPRAIIFSDVGPGCRWMGNERGVAGETNWSTIDVTGFTPGLGAPPAAVLSTGVQGGEAWVPAETDVSIRPGWFYSPSTDGRVKSVSQLMNIWYTSVGRNSNLLLNVPPDRRGLIHPTDSLRLMEFRAAREAAFARDLASGARVSASSELGRRFSAARVVDGNFDTYWAPGEGPGDGGRPTSLEIDLGDDKTFNRFMIQEYIPLGQRVESFTVSCLDGAGGSAESTPPDSWRELVRATTVGYKRILRFPTTTTRRVRIEFTAAAPPLIATVALYNAPEAEADSQAATPAQPVRTLPLGTPCITDLGEIRTVTGFVYTPQPLEHAPNIHRYDLHLSEDGERWTRVKEGARFDNIANSPVPRRVTLDSPMTARYIRLTPVEVVGGGDKYTVAGMEIITR